VRASVACLPGLRVAGEASSAGERGRGAAGPGAFGWVIAAIVVLMLGGLVATIVVSVRHDVASGYIERHDVAPAPAPDESAVGR
jgi:hypothetical protein